MLTLDYLLMVDFLVLRLNFGIEYLFCSLGSIPLFNVECDVRPVGLSSAENPNFTILET